MFIHFATLNTPRLVRDIPDFRVPSARGILLRVTRSRRTSKIAEVFRLIVEDL